MKQAATASKVDLEPQGPPYTDAITETYVRQYGANNSMEWHNITANGMHIYLTLNDSYSKIWRLTLIYYNCCNRTPGGIWRL